MIAGNSALKPSGRKPKILREFAWVATVLAISTCLPLATARADESFTVTADRIIQMLEEIPIGGSIPIESLISNAGIQEVCLVSTDTTLTLDEIGCDVNTPSLLAVSSSGKCSMIDLASLTSRILSGSIETECRPVSPSLAIGKIDRFAQKHIFFFHE